MTIYSLYVHSVSAEVHFRFFGFLLETQKRDNIVNRIYKIVHINLIQYNFLNADEMV